MKKILIILIVLQLIIILFLPSVLSINNTENICNTSNNETLKSIIYVDDDGGADYTKIQDAIDNATTDDTIIVYDGIYNENILINKKLDIIGSEDSNIIGIDEIEGKPVILIEVNGVTLSKFKIQGVFDGIFLSGVNDCQITYNHILNNERGIYLIESFDNVISNNLISQNTKKGVMLQRCAHDYILNNEFTSNLGIAILIFDAANIEIEYNNFQDNRINAFIVNSPINYWNGNYWNRARIFPKIIFGFRTLIPWINIDWNPAIEQNDIS